MAEQGPLVKYQRMQQQNSSIPTFEEFKKQQAADPYAEFQQPAQNNPYAEFQQPAQNNPYAEFQQPAESGSSAPAPEGFGRSLYNATIGPAVGLVNDYYHHVQENQPKYGLAAGFPALVRTGLDVGGGITHDFVDAARKTGEALGEGRFGKVLQQAPGLVPLIGPPVVHAGEQLGAGNYGGALGTSLGLLGTAAAPEILRGTGGIVRAPAATMAETAMGVRGVDRRYFANPGLAILDDTKGVRPSDVVRSGKATMAGLEQRARGLARQEGAMGTRSDLTPPMQRLDAAASVAQGANSKIAPAELLPMQSFFREAEPGFKGATTPHPPTVTQQPSGVLGPNGQPLVRTVSTPSTLPPKVNLLQSPEQYLDMKRRFGKDFVDFRKKEVPDDVNEAAKGAYHEMGQELNRTVPGIAPLNRRMSNLVPVLKRAEDKSLNAGPLQQLLGRFATPTGALTGGVIGAAQGFQHGGLAGAIGGGAMGLGLPTLISSPTAQMIAARGLEGTGKGIQAAAKADNALRPLAVLPRVQPLVGTRRPLITLPPGTK